MRKGKIPSDRGCFKVYSKPNLGEIYWPPCYGRSNHKGWPTLKHLSPSYVLLQTYYISSGRNVWHWGRYDDRMKNKISSVHLIPEISLRKLQTISSCLKPSWLQWLLYLISMWSLVLNDFLHSHAVSCCPPSFPSAALLLSIFVSCALSLPHTPTLPLTSLSSPCLLFSRHVALSLCCHPKEGEEWRQWRYANQGRVPDGVVEETRASSSPSLSSSARWEEPNWSSVCPHQAGWQSQTHLLFTPLINYTQAKGALRGRRLQRLFSTCRPQLQHGDTSQRSALSPYHLCSPSVSLKAGGSLSSCLWLTLLCADVMYLMASLKLGNLAGDDMMSGVKRMAKLFSGLCCPESGSIKSASMMSIFIFSRIQVVTSSC